MKPKLSPHAVNLIETSVEKLFTKAKARFLGRVPPNSPKGLIMSLVPDLSIGGLFKIAAKTENVKHNENLLHSVSQIGLNYLEATKEKAKAKVLQSVQAFIEDANKNDIDTDVETVLGGELSDLWADLSHDVKRIVETETTTARNLSLMDAITKINLSAGISDPVVFFIVVRDNSLCSECKRLHLQKDGKTPRVWRLSEVGNGYHKKGDSNPKAAGLHPHCRCVLTTLLPGYGFDNSGMVEYKSPGYDEYAHQRK